VIKKSGIEYNLLTPSSNTSAHTKLVQTLPWDLSKHMNIIILRNCPCLCSKVKEKGPLLWPERGNTTTLDYGLFPQYNFAK
jgi:hypothetical protein